MPAWLSSSRAGILGVLAGAVAVAALLLLVPSAHAQAPTGGPDAAGYTWIDSTAPGGPAFAFVDISGNGTQVTPSLGDTSQVPVTMPFNFPWYDIWTQQVDVSSNGYICLQVSTSCTSTSFVIGNSADPDYLVAAYRQDLNCNSVPSCAMTHSWGPAGNRVFVVQMGGQTCMPAGTGGACGLSYQFKLFEASGCVEVHYGNLVDSVGDTTLAGIEGRTTTGTYVGLTYYLAGNAAPALQNRAVRYCPGSPPPPAPPVACGYTMASTAYNFTDISATGTPLAHTGGSAIDVTPSPSFGFAFCNTWYFTFKTSSEGMLCFVPTTFCTTGAPSTIPSTGSPNGVVFGYWTDFAQNLCQTATTPCSHWQVLGASPNRVFVYQLTSAPYAAGSGGTATFQIKLREADHCIEVHYQNVGGTSERAIGGLENQAGTSGLMWQDTTPGWTATNQAVRYCHPQPYPPMPPPPCFYTVSTPPVNFIDISATGTPLPHTDDSQIDVFPSPDFNFLFCNTWYSSFRLAANGYLCFGTTSTCTDWSPDTIPNANSPNGVVFGYWADLFNSATCAAGAGQCSMWEVVGPPGNRILVYMFKDAPLPGGAPATFEIQLHEATQCVEVHYLSIPVGATNRAIGGFENQTGSAGITWRDTNPGWTAMNEAVRYCPPTPWPPLPPPPPPACGYTVSTPIYDFVDISATGAGLAHTATSQIDITPSPSFSIPFCGTWMSTFRMSSEGMICLGSPASPLPTTCTSTIPAAIPSTGTPNNVVFGVWTNFNPTFCAGGSTACIKWEVLGTSPNRVLVYMFKDVPYQSSANTATFEFKLFEADGCIEVHYQDVQASPTRAVAGYENSGGTAGTMWRDQTPGWTAALEAVRYCPAQPLPPPPPPVCGYTLLEDAGYDFEDITPTGTGLSMTDNSQVTVTLPFTFNFCGTNYTQVRLSSNGMLCFGPFTACTSSSPTTVPNTFSPDGVIFGYWANLAPNLCAGGSAACAKWEVVGSAPNRVFVYMMKDVPFSGFAPSVSFEIKLFETSNCVEVHYLSVSTPNPTRRAIAGFENIVGNQGGVYADSTPGFTRAGQAWRLGTTCPGTGPDAYTIDEDAPSATYDVLANDVGTVSVVSTTPATFGATAPAATAGVTYVPDPDANGVDTFQYTAQDANGAPWTGRVTMTVRPVNDEPDFVPGPAVQASQAAPPQVVAGWATGVTPAAGLLASPATATDEAGQSITFTATVSNPALFAVQPTLTRTATATSTVPSPAAGLFGMLEFTPSATTYGTSQVCFEALDDGGTANGGDPQGPLRCTTITVAQCEGLPDAYVAYRWWTLDVGAPGVTGNDIGTPLQPSALVTAPANGQVTFHPDGTFSYYPDSTFLGTDQFQYTNTCGTSTSAPIDVTIEVRDNQPPVAYFEQGAGEAVPGQGVGFDPCPGAVPRCSHDPDGEITGYLWEFGDGAVSTMPQPSHIFAQPGTYLVRLTVRDAVGNVSSAFRTIEVEWPGAGEVGNDGGGAQAPLADAGDDLTVPERTRVTLDGSQQGGGDSPVFVWEQVRGLEVTLENASTPNPSFVAPDVPDGRSADLMFRLRVLRGALSSPSDYVGVHVVPAGGAPVADAGETVTVQLGDLVTLDGSGSTDPDGDQLTYRWEQTLRLGDTVANLTDPTSPTPSFAAPATGVMLFRLHVSDGDSVSMDEVMVVVQAVPTPPPVHQAEERDPETKARLEKASMTPWLWTVLGVAGLAALAAVGAIVFVARRWR